MAQFARPDSNVTQTNVTGGFAEIDEATASDADFAYSANNTTATLTVGLSNPTDPSSSTGHVVRYRYAKTNAGTPDSGGSNGTLEVFLLQGAATVIAGSGSIAVSSGTWTAGTFTLTGAEADAITDYTDLRLAFDIVGGGGSPANRRGVGVSWAELEVPDAAAQTPVSLSATTTMTSTVAKATQFVQSLPATTTMSPGIVRAVGLTLLATQGLIAVASRLVGKGVPLAATMGATVAVQVPYARALPVTSAFAASLVSSFVSMRTLAVTATMSASMASVRTYAVALAASAALSPVIVRAIAISMVVALDLPVSVVRHMALAMTVQTALAPTVDDALIRRVTMSAGVTMAAAQGNTMIPAGQGGAQRRSFLGAALLEKRRG